MQPMRCEEARHANAHTCVHAHGPQGRLACWKQVGPHSGHRLPVPGLSMDLPGQPYCPRLPPPTRGPQVRTKAKRDFTKAWLRQLPPRKAVFEQRIIQHIHATHMGAGNRESFITGDCVTKRKNRTGRNGEQAGEMKRVGGAGARPTPRTGRWHLEGRLMASDPS